VAGERWHSDVSCDPEPPFASILYLHTVPPVGGDTLFASQYAAYEALSPRLKAYLEGLTAFHDGGPSYRESNAKQGIAETGKVYPSAVHPVVRTNPATGRKALYVNRGFTVRINELPEEEGRALLNFLIEHSTRPDFQVRFRWRANSVAVWDNRFVQHLAIWDYFPQVRSGFRVTVKGSRPV
jgi:taurine dioxygenase